MRLRIFLIIVIASIVAFAIGPFAFFNAVRSDADRESLARALAVAHLLAEANAAALSGGHDALYNLEVALNESGVKEAFLTDVSGFIVAPAESFHENRAEDPLVKKVLQGAQVSDHRAFLGGYRIVVPVLSGGGLVGTAGVLFSGFNVSGFKYLWSLFKLSFVSIAVMTIAAYAVVELFSGKRECVIPPPLRHTAGGQVLLGGHGVSAGPEQRKNEITAEDLAAHMDSPVVLFDPSFNAFFANKRALSCYPDIVGKHLVDIGGVFLEMAEEMEMLQVDKVCHGKTLLRRYKDGEQIKGYVFFNV